MNAVYWAGCVLAGYLYGSVNFAIIVTRVVAGRDIRDLGNNNPGAANVGRCMGIGWGALVLLLDISKSVVPMLLVRRMLPALGEPLISVAMLTAGLSAVVGHCRPLYYGFRGGRGIATAIGVYVMLVPVEALFCLFAAAGIVAVFVRNVEHRIGPYTPVVFVAATPFVTLATSLLLDVPIFRGIGIGNHSIAEVGGVFVLSLTILAINPSYLRRRLEDLRTGQDPARGGNGGTGS